MAKKKQIIHPVEVKEQVTLGLEADASDIANIGVAEYENKLREALNKARKDWKAAKKEAERLAKSFQKEREARVQSVYARKVDALSAALQSLGVNDEVTLNTGTYDEKKDWISVSMSSATSGTGVVLRPVKAIAKIRDLHRQVQDQNDVVKELGDKIVTLQAEIGNIDYAERQIKAKVSAHILAGSENGKALLAAIGKANIVPALPG